VRLRTRAREGTLIAAVLAVLVGATIDGLHLEGHPVSLTLVTLGRLATITLFLTAGGLRLARWWMTADARSAYMGSALLLLGGVTLPLWHLTRAVSSESGSLVAALVRAVGTAVCLTLVARAIDRGDDDSLRISPPQLLARSVGVTALGSTVVLLAWAGDPHLFHAGLGAHLVVGALMAAGWGAVAFAAARDDLSQRWKGQASPLLAGMALVEVLRVLDLTHPGSWVVGAALLSAALAGLASYGAMLDLVTAAAAESGRVRALSGALRTANAAYTHQVAWREEIVHDLHNAVAGLRAALHALETYDDALDAETASGLRRAAAAEVDHIEHLVTPPAHEGTVAFELLPVVHGIVRIRRATGQVIRLSGSAGLVLGRPGDVATVLQNLLVNAAVHAPTSPVTVTISDGDGMVELRVSDRGPGLTAEQAARVFERGARGERSGGSGLGLYVARSLMRRRGGDVELRNRVDGATFVVLIPALERRASPTTSQAVAR
jgi:signal transduction histidine kinase